MSLVLFALGAFFYFAGVILCMTGLHGHNDSLARTLEKAGIAMLWPFGLLGIVILGALFFVMGDNDGRKG